MILADGAYQFTRVPLYGPAFYVVATVRGGLVAAWAEQSQDGRYRTPATVRDLEHGENYLAALKREIEVSRRLAGMGHPQVEFTPAAALPLHNPTTGTVYVPVQIGARA